MKTWVVIDDEVENLKAVVRGIRKQPACATGDEVFVLWAKTGGTTISPFAKLQSAILKDRITVLVCKDRSAIVKQIGDLSQKRVLLLSDMNLVGIQTFDSYLEATNELRLAIQNLLKSSASSVVCFYSSQAGAGDVASNIGNSDMRSRALGKWLDKSRTSMSLDDQVRDLVAAASEHWNRCHGHRLEMLWNNPDQRDWFVGNSQPVPHLAAKISDAAEYKKAIDTVLGIDVPKAWVSEQHLSKFHEGLKGLCGAHFYGRELNPTSNGVKPDKGFRLGSVVILALLACHSTNPSSPDRCKPFDDFDWKELGADVNVSESEEKERVQLQAMALYDFFCQLFQIDPNDGRQRGIVTSVGTISSKFGIKLTFSQNVDGLKREYIKHCIAESGKFTGERGNCEQGKWLRCPDKLATNTKSAFLTVLHSLALEPGHVFTRGKHLYITSTP